MEKTLTLKYNLHQEAPIQGRGKTWYCGTNNEIVPTFKYLTPCDVFSFDEQHDYSTYGERSNPFQFRFADSIYQVEVDQVFLAEKSFPERIREILIFHYYLSIRSPQMFVNFHKVRDKDIFLVLSEFADGTASGNICNDFLYIF